MHRLRLLPHAKSDRDQPVDDKERRLSRRGREAARRVGEALPEALGTLDLVLCSTSLRTRETAELVLVGYAAPPRILYEDALYLAGSGALLRRLRSLDEKDEAVPPIPHPPGLPQPAIGAAAVASPPDRQLPAGQLPTTARGRIQLDGEWRSL